MDKKDTNEGISVKGFFRMNIVNEDGSIAGDSGWRTNQITNDGFSRFLIYTLAGSAGSSLPGFFALGNGTAPAAAATTLPTEHTSVGVAASMRPAVTKTLDAGSKAITFTGTYASNWNTTPVTIANIGLYASSSGGTLFAGNTYNSSACATNQAVNVTYTISFS